MKLQNLGAKMLTFQLIQPNATSTVFPKSSNHTKIEPSWTKIENLHRKMSYNNCLNWFWGDIDLKSRFSENSYFCHTVTDIFTKTCRITDQPDTLNRFYLLCYTKLGQFWLTYHRISFITCSTYPVLQKYNICLKSNEILQGTL